MWTVTRRAPEPTGCAPTDRRGAQDRQAHKDLKNNRDFIMLAIGSIVASAFSPAVSPVGFATSPAGRAAVITAAAKPELLVYDRKYHHLELLRKAHSSSLSNAGRMPA
jgi:hypothetical protein